MRVRAQLAALAALVVGFAYSSDGLAFCRTTTCDKCMQGPSGECITEGIPLFWPVACMSYDLQQDGSRRVGYDEVSAAADAAFQTWGNVNCPNGLAPTLEFLNMGPVACDRHEYNDQSKSFGGNANIIIFRDEGLDQSATDQLAITTVTFNVNTGEIYDADIEVDSLKPISTSTPVPAKQFDLQSILTHEIGHFLGLAHSDMPCVAGPACATMDATYRMGSDDFRTLEADDIAGICTIYPPDRTAIDNGCAPRHGFSGECGVASKKGCCTTAPGGASDHANSGLVALLCGVTLFVARSRRK